MALTIQDFKDILKEGILLTVEKDDNKRNKACCCDQILMGKMQPQQCPLFGKVCKPLTPQGACMVSEEGSCHSAFASF